ncbi:hypothetical protein HK097_004049 [Rhizophlyctis rosea]|uniref:Uncharacterized protein n=1 Tax=Rhizophlyctis rosea TaxID=64517 RepID=A0AAD5SL52_9FUNG|nr:hypothetical protein HK097_004049 [Rhizophlyctis rosea]
MSIKAKLLAACFGLSCLPTAIGIIVAAGWLFKWLVPEWLIPDEADIEPPRPRRPRNMFYGNYNFAPSATTLDDELDMVEGLNIYSYSRTPWEGEVFRHERFERRPQTFTADHHYRTTDESYRNRTWRSASVTSMSTLRTQSSGTTNRQIAPGTTIPQQTSPHTSPTPKSAQRRRNTFHSPPASPPHAQQRRKSPPESPAPIQTGGRGKIVELPASPTSPEREEKEVVGKTPAEGEDKKVRRDSRASFDSGYGTEGAAHSPESPVASS